MKKNNGIACERISLKDLAARLNTSICTVSKALHNKPKISEAMRAKVLNLVKELGYAPNLAASSMARHLFRVGWIYPAAWPSYHKALLQGGIQRVAELRDYNLSITPFPFDGINDQNSCIDKIHEVGRLGFDAMVLYPCAYKVAGQKKIAEALKKISCPVVLLGCNTTPAHTLLCNVRQHSLLCGKMAGNLATLLLNGYGSAGLIVGSSEVEDHRNKINGFRAMLQQGNIAFAGYAESLDIPEKAYDAMRDLLSRAPQLSLVYVGTENIQGVLAYLKKHHLLGRIKIIASGTSEIVNQGLHDGTIQFALDEKPLQQGQAAIDAVCQKLLLNQQLPPQILVPPSIRINCQLDENAPTGNLTPLASILEQHSSQIPLA